MQESWELKAILGYMVIQGQPGLHDTLCQKRRSEKEIGLGLGVPGHLGKESKVQVQAL